VSDPARTPVEDPPAEPLVIDEELKDRDPSSYSIRDLFRDGDQ